MRATLAAIADSARVEAGEKLHVNGIFDTIFAESFPAVHPKMVLVVRLQLEANDASRVRGVRVRLCDEQGQLLFEQTARAQVGIVPPGEMPCTNLIYQLANTTFHGPGRYHFLVDADRTHVRLPLRVVGRDA